MNNYGDANHPSTEVMWDEMLSAGKLIYGVSSDDAHHFQTIAPNKSNPGRGWVMVRAATLDPDTITAAMLQGEFYASNGVFLKRCDRGPDRYRVEVDTRRTRRELETNWRLRGRFVERGTKGYRIELIGPQGTILETVRGTRGEFLIDRSLSYVRAKVTFTRRKPQTNQLEEYYAWGQPFFADGRAPQPAPRVPAAR